MGRTDRRARVRARVRALEVVVDVEDRTEDGRALECYSWQISKFRYCLHIHRRKVFARAAMVNQKSWVLIITTREMTSTVIETYVMTNVYRAMRARWSGCAPTVHALAGYGEYLRLLKMAGTAACTNIDE